MEGLGKDFNVAPIVGAGAAISLKGQRGVTFVCSGNDTFTLTASATFGGSYTTPGNIITRKYTCTATDGTAAWVLATQAAAAAVTISSGLVAIYVDADSLPDGVGYVKCTHSSAGLVVAITNELTIKRSADRLAALSA